MGCLPILIANKIFHVTVLLIIYFCDQFVALKIRHSRCHCSVCQQDNNQHGIQRRGEDFNKKFVFGEIYSKQINRRIS